MSFRVRKRFILPLSLFLNAVISWLSLATRCDLACLLITFLDTENMSKITAILHHVDISLKEVNHVRTITNELGTHGLIYYDYLPQLVLGLLGVVTVLACFVSLFFLFKTFASVLLTQKAKRLHQSNPEKNKDLRRQSEHVFGQWSRGTRGHWLPPSLPRFCSLLHRVSHLLFEIPRMFLSCSLGVIVVQCARPGWISGSDTGNTLSRGSVCHSREWGTTILAIWLI
ncbi:hypothetical protein V8E52_011490 [Russula decolorans]